MKRIPLADGERVMLVDDEDYERFASLPVRYDSRGYATYPTSGDRDNRGWTAVHRTVAGADSNEMVDHINGNGLDNRRANLRLVTREQNQWNRASNQGCASRFKGVWWSKQGGGKWAADITANGKRYRLGRFATEEDAARAYDEAARHLHGEYGSFNFPEPGETPALREPAHERHEA